MAGEVHDQCRDTLEDLRGQLQRSLDALDADGADAAEGADLVDKLRETLNEVEDALARMANGTFGVCEQCKGTIADGRLVDLPAARHCGDCAAAQSSVIAEMRDLE